MNNIKFHLRYIPAPIEWTGLSLRGGGVILHKFVGPLLLPGGLRCCHDSGGLVELLAPKQLLLVEGALHLKGFVGFDVADGDWEGGGGGVVVSGAAGGDRALVAHREDQVLTDESGVVYVLFVNTIWYMVDICGEVGVLVTFLLVTKSILLGRLKCHVGSGSV
jgi:hypothetical protein